MVIKSPHPAVNIPDVDIWTLLFERPAAEKPCPDDKELFIDGLSGRSYNFTQLKQAAIEFGKGLKSQWGLKKGDVIGIFSPNSMDYPVVCFGALWAGVVCSTNNPTYTAKELAHQLKDSACKGLVTQAPLLPVALEAARAVGIPEDRVVLMDTARDPSGGFRHFSEIRDSGGLLSKLYGRGAKFEASKDVAFLVYSSGTTGLPKGVQLTHGNIVSNLIQFTSVEKRSGLHCLGGPDGKGDKQIAVLPFFHVYGLTCILHATVFESFQAIVLPKFELDAFCKLVQDYGVTFAYIPPPIVLGLAKHPVVDSFDLTSLKWLNSGAAPLTRELIDGVWDRLTIPVKQGYGLSETAPVSHLMTVLEWAKWKGSVGCLAPNMEAKIVDAEGRELPSGQEGEIWLKGPNVFPGYLNKPELDKEIFSEDGFFKTGDIGYVDARGLFYVTDRLKELIKYKGFQVAPAELEGILVGHADIADACVIPAFDHGRSTEVPRAYVVLRTGLPRTEEKAAEIARWVEDKVAPHKRLRGGVRFIDEVPKNASGKILRRVLKDQAKQEDRAAGAKL